MGNLGGIQPMISYYSIVSFCESSARSSVTQDGGKNSSTICHIIAKRIINI